MDGGSGLVTAAVAAMAPPRRPPAKVRLGAEIAWTTLRVRRLVHRNDLPTALERCRAATGQGAPAPSRDEVVRVASSRTENPWRASRRLAGSHCIARPHRRARAPRRCRFTRCRAPSQRVRRPRVGRGGRVARAAGGEGQVRAAGCAVRTPAAERAGGLARPSRRGGSRWRGGSGARRTAPPRRGSRRTTARPR